MHAMWKPQKFKAIYLLATLYVLDGWTLLWPSYSHSFGAYHTSIVGSLLQLSLLNPALAYIFTFRSAAARENAVEQPPKYFGRWVGAYVINIFVVVWVLIVGFGFGGWASVTNFIHQIDTFGLFTKCYQCPPPPSPPHLAANATAPLPSPPPRIHHP
ncbi:UNVERIFIED_CONTAM: Auxin transporter-like protein 5 [Sesamum radiatum]|uniref:Auxin transporter-like protein 5 n=1 Tax=Sesamum radiatum TaxID=300843 RepID=A0AAW2S2Z3_SESRA